MKTSRGRVVVALLGASGVSAAAFYAHGLEAMASPAQMRNWAIACAMQLVTTPAVLGRLVRSPSGVESLTWSGRLMSCGTFVFSGSLYLMALGWPRWLGAVTPLGGLLLIVGWLLVAFEKP